LNDCLGALGSLLLQFWSKQAQRHCI